VSFVRELEEKNGAEEPFVLVDVSPEIVVRADLPDAAEFTNHRHDIRQELRQTGRADQLSHPLEQLFVDQGGQPQRLDPIEVGVRRRLDTPVHVSDMVEQCDRDLPKCA
jgi:hypothetical protein